MWAVTGQVLSMRSVSAASMPVTESSIRITAGGFDDRFKARPGDRNAEPRGPELRLANVARHRIAVGHQHERRNATPDRGRCRNERRVGGRSRQS